MYNLLKSTVERPQIKFTYKRRYFVKLFFIKIDNKFKTKREKSLCAILLDIETLKKTKKKAKHRHIKQSESVQSEHWSMLCENK